MRFFTTKAQRHQIYKIILFMPYLMTATLKFIRKPSRLPVNFICDSSCALVYVVQVLHCF